MKFGVPWSVKGIRPEARETAKEAARRSGLSLGDWLNTVIVQQAAQAGLIAQPHARAHGDAVSYSEELAGVHQRLDDLTRRIELFTRTGPAAYAPRRQHDESETAELIGRLDRRLDHAVRQAQPIAPPLAPATPAPMMPEMPQTPSRPNVQLPSSLDRALAEIAARQRMLNDKPAPARPVAAPPMQPAQPQPSAPPRAAVPTQDISGLEEQLRKITEQIETLRKPGVEEAINALRGELADIGRALDDAMPKRAIDTIEKQIAGLSQRIAEGRQAGVDAGALAGLEHGLTEVRDALRGLMPAEHLIGFNDAVAGLAEKIDLIVAEKDPATLRQLEDAIATLRGMASHVASDETVSRLAAEVQGLAEKVEQIGRGPAGDVLNNLENRIDALSRALAERAQAGDTVPPRLEALVHSLSDKVEQISRGPADDVLNGLENRIDNLSRALAERAQAGDTVPPRLEALVHSLSDKIDQIQQSRGDNVALSHLEDRIVMLVERLDASDSRLGHLEAIERGIADLLVHIEEMRADKQDTRAGDSPVVEALKYDMARTEDALKHDMARTQDALDAVHGTLGLVVDRLALIEQDIRSERQAPPPTAESEPLELSQPVGKLAVRLVSDSPEAAPAPALLMPPHPPEASAPAASALEQPLAASRPSMPAYTPAASAPVHMPAAAQSPMPAQAPAAPQAPPAAQAAAAPAPQAKPQPQPAPASVRPRLPSAAQLPIDPDLPRDQPLEPGSGPPPRAHPAARIAASEAALGGARPAPPAAGGQSNFIAAARRAAKAALQEHEVNALRAVEPAEPAPRGRLSSLRDKMMKRVKSLLVAASIVAVVVGSAQIAGIFRGTGGMTKTAQHLSAKPAKAPAVPKLAAAPLAPAASNPLMAPAPVALPPHTRGTAQRMPDLLNPPALYSGRDITGSIPDAARSHHPAPPPAVAPVDDAERLPSAIGSPHLRKAALAGDAGAAYEVAVRFAEGRGVPANPREAAHWYERAAAKGLAVAQFRYASALEKGLGVKKDLARARRLYHAAAGQGNAKAMHNLAVLYAEGIDGKPDYATAVAWFRKAAQHGVADSQYNLGVLYARGIGVDQNLGESYKWFALAAAHGDKDAAKKRDDVAGHLDAKELAAARRAVKSFTVAPQPQTATAVPVPPGGWDKADATPAKTPEPRPHPAGPLSVGSFTVGKR
jgi:localization factor PodJL